MKKKINYKYFKLLYVYLLLYLCYIAQDKNDDIVLVHNSVIILDPILWLVLQPALSLLNRDQVSDYPVFILCK